jgi:hypothetical protein
MPLQKILFKPGVNRENTRYTTEGGWYECDKIRFRQGNPETLGGWVPYSLNTFQGVCRSLNNWVTLNNENLVGVGTNLKFYIENGGAYYNITPIRETATINNNPFALTASTTVTVTDTSHGCSTGDFVTFSGAVDIGSGGTNVTAAVLNQEFQVTVVDVNTYTITISVTPNATAIAGSPGGGSAVVAAYQLNVGPALAVPLTGWGAGAWDQAGSTWGNTTSTTQFVLRQWNQQNYGEDLVFGPRGGGLYYWDATGGVSTRGVLLNSLGGTVTFTTASPTVVTLTNLLTEGTAVQFSVSSGGTLPTGISAATTYYLFNVLGLTANLIDISGNLINVTGAGSGTFSISLLVDVPTVQNYILVSDTSRFIFAFGCNDYGAATADPMLIRWSDQDNVREWTPDATNQAGSIRLSRGSEIVTALQTRQEIVVFTDSSVYSVQYLGPPVVWSTQILGDNISIAGQNAAIIASGVIYWMGVDKFYAYDGRVQTLNCDVRRYVFSDFNLDQRAQVFAGTNEAFNEVWWLYCSADASYPDRYVIYNYLERIWYYGTLSRSAWLDSGLSAYPYATTYDSSTQTGRLIAHENGINDNTDGTAVALSANISSSEFDINDGHNFGFVWRIIPDITFNNSTNSPTNLSPRVTMTLRALYNSGSGQIDSANGVVAQGANYVITEEFTGQIFTRVRGRQMIFEISSNQLNTCWQLGAPRIDIKPDGRR